MRLVFAFAVVATALAACTASHESDLLSSSDAAAPLEDGGGPSPSSDSGTPPDPPPADAGTDADAAPPGKNYHQGSSAGCGKAGATTGAETRTKTIAGKARTYVRFVPATYKPNVPLAVVFGFHGSGGTAAGARATFDLEAKAAGKAIFLYPQGLPDPAFGGDNRWDPTKGSDDYAFVDAILAELEAAYCVDRDRVFAAGFSNGARFTSMLGCYRGDAFRAIAPVAPGGDSKTLLLAGCVGEVAVWEGLGTEDPDHEPGAVLVRDFYRTANGCAATRTPTTPTGCEAYDGCRAPVPSVWCTYPGGHAWPPIGAAGVWGFFAGLK